jgi:hypothetical protein
VPREVDDHVEDAGGVDRRGVAGRVATEPLERAVRVGRGELAGRRGKYLARPRQRAVRAGEAPQEVRHQVAHLGACE